ncbi:MAG: N-acetyltransferase [Clostridium thermopalmarium]|uniref:Acetyltransferase n=1 Tax=Clostridium cochlearium TaxID=1494 RepID=A0A2X2WGN1_CLOCO|nr:MULTISPECIES: N-acetyltransferase [Clostridium]MBE6043161.1 N-acetyltransferase [Clostridium thermopalmarium]SQB35185.1 acetyltransferase [Clostridium cochlearium]
MIREFKETDLNSIMRLWLETNISAHDFIDENYWRGNYAQVRQMILKATIYIYEENSIKGFTGLSGNYIAGIFVESNSQSKGIGKALLDHIKERNKELFLHVYKKNKRAVKFYLREGFVIDNEQIDKNTNEIELAMKWIDK